MQTLESLLKKGTTILKDNGLEEAGLDAWLLLEFKTGKNRAYYFAHGDEPVSDETAAEYLTLIDRRAGHIPVQQLTHQAFFMGYEFYVNENVLIPRQDTETLVEEALKHLGDVEKPEILDMCTGSGCILLSLLLEWQLHQKMHGSRSIRQRMKYLEIDPVLIIAHPKKKRFFVRNIKSAAGCACFFLYHCRNITSLQIKPEQSLS